MLALRNSVGDLGNNAGVIVNSVSNTAAKREKFIAEKSRSLEVASGPMVQLG
jgi:hypothetical protein